MKTREYTTEFLSAEEILSNRMNYKFIRWVREAYAGGKLRIRCKTLQEQHAIFQVLFNSILRRGSAEAR